MNNTSTDKYTLFTAVDSFESFKKEFSLIFADYSKQNIVIDLSKIETSEKEIQSLEEFAETQIENNQSFAIIVPVFNADAFEEELNVVPTLTEAEDIIDMDEMTRDLEF